MGYCISKPSSYLAEYVKLYWAIDNVLPEGEEHIQRIVPNGLSDLIFYLGDRPESADGNKSITENTLFTGQLGAYYDLKVSGELSLFSIIFQPYGLSIFFNIPINEFFDQTVPLNDVIKDVASELENKLYEAVSFSERQLIAEQFLMDRLKKSTKRDGYNRIKESIKTINESRGIVSIDYLASEACLSRKQFERIFSEYIGISPKKFLKTVRFQNAINEKSRDKNLNLTTLTYQCGYFDQSHMCNDFRQLSGMTPKNYFSDCEPYSDYFQ